MLIRETGCTEQQADIAIRREGWSATREQLIHAVHEEIAYADWKANQALTLASAL
jgi:hypothetical protein